MGLVFALSLEDLCSNPLLEVSCFRLEWFFSDIIVLCMLINFFFLIILQRPFPG